MSNPITRYLKYNLLTLIDIKSVEGNNNNNNIKAFAANMKFIIYILCFCAKRDYIEIYKTKCLW